MQRILREHKDKNADQNAETAIWVFYGTGSDKTPNRSHLLKKLVFFGARMDFYLFFMLKEGTFLGEL